MDVVKRNLEALRGTAEIYSEPGAGSTFRMRLPLTLAIIDGMVVNVNGQRYVIPTVSIVRTVQPSKEERATLLRTGELLSIQDKLIPLFRLGHLFEDGCGCLDADGTLVLVVEHGDNQVGLLIDELLGRQQVVIKNLGETLRNIPGISGGAIMPDGRVGLIVDVDSLVRLAGCVEGGPTVRGGEAVEEELPA
jgi:two-component system chemotaxis sensor kinase CheA